MARKGKWLENVAPDQPVSVAASMAIEERLGVVWQHAPKAAEAPEEDIEHVHQLRVATRRSVAALKAFHQLLPDKRTRKMTKLLKRVRRAAGDARDLDVLQSRLQKHMEQRPAESLQKLLSMVAELRCQAQEPLKKAFRRLKRKDFPQRSEKFVSRVKWRGEGGEPDFATAARDLLRPVIDEFFTAAAADLSDIEALHRMRINGKRLRYAMELGAAAFDPSFRKELYPTFSEVQEKLGTINDHATALAMYAVWLEQVPDAVVRDELQTLVDDEQAQLAQDADRFRQWWTAERSQNLKQRFDAFVGQRVTSDPGQSDPESADASSQYGPSSPVAAADIPSG